MNKWKILLNPFIYSQFIILFSYFFMPKQKSNRGASKRFRVTASGKVRFKHAFKNHILTKKSKKRKKAMGKPGYVAEVDLDRVKDMLAL